MSVAEQIETETVEPKMISRSTYLKALALFTLARNYWIKCNEIEDELGIVLGYETDPDMPAWGHYAGHITDAIGEPDMDFDDAMAREGFVVESKP